VSLGSQTEGLSHVTYSSEQTLKHRTVLLLRLLVSVALQIAKSPLSANVAVEYVVTAAGVQQAPSMDGQAAMAVLPHSALDIPIAKLVKDS
jgi:hypothetical protein